MQKVTALVPMKGHSERVLNKNLRDFSGEPLFFRILQTLEKAENVESVYINTDSEEIASKAKENFDVSIIWRPKDLVGDFVSMNKIIEYDLSQIYADHFIQTHATNPLLTPLAVDNAVKQYFDNLGKYDSLFSVTKLQVRLYDKDLMPINHNPQELLRTQDLTPLYEENSNFYIFSKDSFKSTGQRIGVKPYMYELDKSEALDIDEEIDFMVAESIYRHKYQIREVKKRGSQ